LYTEVVDGVVNDYVQCICLSTREQVEAEFGRPLHWIDRQDPKFVRHLELLIPGKRGDVVGGVQLVMEQEFVLPLSCITGKTKVTRAAPLWNRSHEVNRKYSRLCYDQDTGDDLALKEQKDRKGKSKKA